MYTREVTTQKIVFKIKKKNVIQVEKNSVEFTFHSSTNLPPSITKKFISIQVPRRILDSHFNHLLSIITQVK
ncbi:hypothetical protein GW891_02680 [bacterium]|nr:hypothetical protein [bacterium]